MKLAHIISEFRDQPPGTDAYQRLKEQSLQLIGDDPSNAAAYFLIFGFARSYVLLYEEEAVTVDTAHAAKAQMLDYLQRISDSLGLSTESRLQTLNDITTHYLNSTRIF
jgi:hypothetical protein